MKLFTAFFTVFLSVTSLCFAQKIDFSKLKNLNIRNIGPANMSGRITCIDVVRDNAKIIYLGAASGGVWKSENGGSAWEPLFDKAPSQNIGAIAIDQKNPEIIWVGTGEGNPRNSMNLGMGVFKSVNGGKSWQSMGLEKTKTIHRIIVDPLNSNIIYVGAMGDPFSGNEHRGLFKSEDGGQHWKKILYSNEWSGIADLVMDPNDNKRLFAALYEHKRSPYFFTSGGKGSGLYLSENAGKSWIKLTEKNGLPKGDLGRIGLAIAPSNPKRMYAKIEAEKNALYRSDTAGKDWELINDNPKFTNNRPFYFQDLAVDTKDADRLYNIYQPLSVSYDGGLSFDPTPMIPADETKGIHADFHAFWVNPVDPKHFIIGGDGGIGITYDHGKSWYFPESIPVAQFYHIGVDQDTPYNVYGGMQDNGNWSGPAYTWKRGGIRTLYWQYLVGGDGFDISPDLDNSRFGYGSSQNGNLYRYDKLTGYYVGIKPPSEDLNIPLRFNWNAAFAKDPFNSNAAYYGSQYVHYTENKGASWRVISPDLTTNNPEEQKEDYGGLTLDVSGAERYNAILSIAPSSLDKNIIWAGTDDGQVQLTLDGGSSWKNVTENIKGMPEKPWITQIEASRYEKGTAWLVLNNYRKGDYSPYLFNTKDFGAHWELMVSDQEVKGYALSMIQDPVEQNLVFLGTENGLWVSINQGAHWEKFSNGFPSVSTMDLKIQEPESALIIGTFGRAIWIIDDLLSLREIAKNNLKKGLTALPMNKVIHIKGLFINPPGNIWSGFNTTFEGENKLFQKAKIPYYLSDLPLNERVTATIYNSDRQLIKTIEDKPTEQGLNYLIWELDEDPVPTYANNNEYKYRKGIPILTGVYKIELQYSNFSDTQFLEVVEDPRFTNLANIELDLYSFRKELERQTNLLKEVLDKIDQKIGLINTLLEKKENLTRVEKMKFKLLELRALGEITKPNRQIGAWQSFKITAASSLEELKQISEAQTTKISIQNKKRLEKTADLIHDFSIKTEAFMSLDWSEWEATIEQ